MDDKEIETILQHTHDIAHWGSVLMYKHISLTLGLNIPNLLKRCVAFCKKCPACLRVNKYTQLYAPPKMPKRWMPMEFQTAD